MWRGGRSRRDDAEAGLLAQRAGALLQAGRQAHGKGLLDQAEEYLREAAVIGRLLGERQPDDPYTAQGLGRVLYSLGGVIKDQHRNVQAVEVLSEAEHVYLDAARLTPAEDATDDDIDLRLADVRLRRGMAFAGNGAGASAVGDAQAAVLAYAEAGRQGRTDEVQLGAARVLMQAADVYGSAADLEMALATAQEGLILAVQGANQSSTPMDPVIARSAAMAADVELAVLTATGRTSETSHPQSLLEHLGVTPPLPTLTRTRLADARRRPDQGGVRSAVHQLDRLAGGPPQLAGIQLDPEPFPLVAPALRVTREQLPAAATLTADAATRLLQGNVVTAFALGLEAHWMLLHLIGETQELTRASGLAQPDLPLWFCVWADLLGPLTRRAQTLGDDDLGRDLAGWGLTALQGVPVESLPPGHQSRMREAASYFERYRSW